MAKLDKTQIIKKVYDSTSNTLKGESHGSADSQGTNLDEGQVWKKAFNSSTGKLRTVSV